jgi:hypothetical protein
MSCRLLLAVVFIVGCQPPAPGYRIVVVPKGMTHEFWQSISMNYVALILLHSFSRFSPLSSCL